MLNQGKAVVSQFLPGLVSWNAIPTTAFAWLLVILAQLLSGIRVLVPRWVTAS